MLDFFVIFHSRQEIGSLLNNVDASEIILAVVLNLLRQVVLEVVVAILTQQLQQEQHLLDHLLARHFAYLFVELLWRVDQHLLLLFPFAH